MLTRIGSSGFRGSQTLGGLRALGLWPVGMGFVNAFPVAVTPRMSVAENKILRPPCACGPTPLDDTKVGSLGRWHVLGCYATSVSDEYHKHERPVKLHSQLTKTPCKLSGTNMINYPTTQSSSGIHIVLPIAGTGAEAATLTETHRKPDAEITCCWRIALWKEALNNGSGN